MSEPPKEFAQLSELTKVPKEERQRRFRQAAEEIQLQNPEQFTDVVIDYTRPFGEFRKELARRIKRGVADTVVLVQMAQAGLVSSPLMLVDPDRVEFLLGKRSAGRIYGGTWAPIMGKVEEEDLVHPMLKKPLSLPKNLRQFRDLIYILRTWRPKSFGEFLGHVPALREQLEEVTLWPIQSNFLVADSYKDQESGRIIHVVIQSYNRVSDPVDQAFETEGKHLKATRGENSVEHDEIRWFQLTNLPLDQMADGTKKALKNALLKLAEIQM